MWKPEYVSSIYEALSAFYTFPVDFGSLQQLNGRRSSGNQGPPSLKVGNIKCFYLLGQKSVMRTTCVGIVTRNVVCHVVGPGTNCLPQAVPPSEWLAWGIQIARAGAGHEASASPITRQQQNTRIHNTPFLSPYVYVCDQTNNMSSAEQAPGPSS